MPDGSTVTPSHTDHNKKPRVQSKAASLPSHGPGTELAKILASIRIHANEGCGCKSRIDQMNRWGVAGCRENFETIVAWLDEGQHQWHWTSKIAIGWATLTSGLAFEIDPLHPFRSLVQLAIDRAESAALSHR